MELHWKIKLSIFAFTVTCIHLKPSLLKLIWHYKCKCYDTHYGLAVKLKFEPGIKNLF